MERDIHYIVYGVQSKIYLFGIICS